MGLLNQKWIAVISEKVMFLIYVDDTLFFRPNESDFWCRIGEI